MNALPIYLPFPRRNALVDVLRNMAGRLRGLPCNGAELVCFLTLPFPPHAAMDANAARRFREAVRRTAHLWVVKAGWCDRHGYACPRIQALRQRCLPQEIIRNHQLFLRETTGGESDLRDRDGYVPGVYDFDAQSDVSRRNNHRFGADLQVNDAASNRPVGIEDAQCRSDHGDAQRNCLQPAHIHHSPVDGLSVSGGTL